MRLITYRNKNDVKLGAWINDDKDIVDVFAAADLKIKVNKEDFESMQCLINAGSDAWTLAR